MLSAKVTEKLCLDQTRRHPKIWEATLVICFVVEQISEANDKLEVLQVFT